MGFTFDDTDTKGVASPLAEMHRLIANDPRNAERIFAYIGGEEVNDSATHAHHRYVINFEDFPLRRHEAGQSWFQLTEETQRAQLREGVVAPDYPHHVAADWPDLLSIVEARVKGTRASHSTAHWWHFERYRVDLQKAICALESRERVVVRSLTSTRYAFAFIPARMVHDQTLIVFCLSRFSQWALLSCRVHELWASFFGATFKDDSRYNVGDCFESFPFSVRVLKASKASKQRAKHTTTFRAALMVRNNEGLTKTYNRFHDPGEMSE